MTLLEAIKSGKPFRRARWGNTDSPNGYYRVRDGSVMTVSGDELKPEVVDLLADDWELYEEHKSFTKTQIKNIIAPYVLNDGLENCLKELGFTS